MSEMLMEDYIREQINKGQYGVIVIPISTAEDIAYYIENSRKKTEPVRHGKWHLEVYPDGCVGVRCSICGRLFEYILGLENEWSFCQHCGAKMDMEEE